MHRELREENLFLKLKNSLQRKYPIMTKEQLKNKCLQYMQAQLKQTFEMETASISSSKISKKTMEELKKSLNQDFDTEIPEKTQDPNQLEKSIMLMNI